VKRAAARLRLEQIAPFEIDGERVSSSLVRASLEAGDLVHDASARASVPDQGRVQAGSRLGRTLGFPTANPRCIARSSRCGASSPYAVGGALADLLPIVIHAAHPGLRREFHEVCVAELREGRLLRVDFVARLRDELKFESLDALVEQMHLDAAEARAALGIHEGTLPFSAGK
jgi:riboflavin kinase/FMN adenylyltransferase